MTYTIYVCPECGEMTVSERMPCGNHGDVWGPYGEPLEVIPRSVADELAAELEAALEALRGWGSYGFQAPTLAKYRGATK